MGVGERVQRLHHQCRGFDREELPADVSLPLSGVLFSFSPFFSFSFIASSQSFAAHSFTKCLFYVVPAPGDGMGAYPGTRCTPICLPDVSAYCPLPRWNTGSSLRGALVSCLVFFLIVFSFFLFFEPSSKLVSFLSLLLTLKLSNFALTLYTPMSKQHGCVNILISRVQHVTASANHVAGLTTPFPCLGVPSSLVIS